ncbi:PREDICTED: B-cell lymphoma/leukemia 10 [Dipodomys ordii]|uniref:B-cell lymphoma/leukemia 10 n=1 Tax=Dipodomys ordii TaxID=10020 RepID=A0A1S3FBN2_DIPOR|nr:PREDICTED: B-cell lymphoma/leukemia 10 [Dipodomys ordii]
MVGTEPTTEYEYAWPEVGVYSISFLFLFHLHLNNLIVGLQCSSCEPFPDGATNNLARSNSDESNFSEKRRASTVTYHPDGESNTAPFFSTDSSLNLPVLEVGRTENSNFSSTTLPRPGDPGAPPLPPELQLEDGGTCGNSSELFLPLRSRTVSRQ